MGKRADVPLAIRSKLRSICLGLPDVYEEKAWVGTRWMIRKRNFAHVVKIDAGWPPAYAAAAGSAGPLVVLTFRASGLLYDTLRTTGHPFFHAMWGIRWGTKVIGMALDKRVDWDEVAVLLTESYRLLAPAALVAKLPGQKTGRRRSSVSRPALVRPSAAHGDCAANTMELARGRRGRFQPGRQRQK